jgi:4-carboxymuconolactone decarboxylase
MARLPYVELADMPESLQRAFATVPPLNLFKEIAHAPEATLELISLASALVTRGELDPVLRELVILRVGILSGADYEVHQHRQIAHIVGVTQSQIDALTGETNSDAFDPIEQHLLGLTDALVRGVKAPEELLAPVLAELSSGAFIEVLILIGYYMMVSRLMVNLQVEIEDVDMINIDNMKPNERAPRDDCRRSR